MFKKKNELVPITRKARDLHLFEEKNSFFSLFGYETYICFYLMLFLWSCKINMQMLYSVLCPKYDILFRWRWLASVLQYDQ